MGGGTKSGSPVETRGAAGSAGGVFQGLFSDTTTERRGPFGFERDISTPISFEDFISRLGEASGRLSQGAAQNVLGFDPNSLGFEESARTALSAPSFDLSEMFAALQPFEDRERDLTISGVRNQFGTAGGRFSRNLSEAEGFTRGALADQNARRREQLSFASFQDAEQRRLQAIDTLGGQRNQAAQIGQNSQQQLLQSILQFLQPGSSTEDPGFLPGLLQAGATVGGAALLASGNPAGATVIAS